MGRKKKVQTPEPTTESVNVEGIQTIGYQGTVEVGIKHGNRLITSKKYSNHGREPLFRFLANCLGGNITESLRPTKIRLFIYKDAEEGKQEQDLIKPTAIDAPNGWANHIRELPAISPFITYNTTPTVDSIVTKSQNENEITGYEVTLHFSIPFAYISGAKIYAMGLYPTNVTNNADASAYFLYTQEKDRTKWEPYPLETASGDYTFVISWKLSISNLTASENNQGD